MIFVLAYFAENNEISSIWSVSLPYWRCYEHIKLWSTFVLGASVPLRSVTRELVDYASNVCNSILITQDIIVILFGDHQLCFGRTIIYLDLLTCLLTYLLL